jgi:hypothetical protein
MRSPAQIQKMLTNLFEEGQRVRAVHLYMLIFDSTFSEAHHTLSKNNEVIASNGNWPTATDPEGVGKQREEMYRAVQKAKNLGDLLADILSKSRK